MAGWICLHRKMLEWEWYDDHNVTRLFIHCIFRANYEPKKWQGVDISRGEFITSFDKLSREVGLTVKQTRLSINKLKKTNELSTRSTSRHTVVTVISYDSYQRKDGEGASEGRTTGQAKDKQKTSKGQAEGEQRATDNNITNKQINNITNKQDNNTSSPAAKKIGIKKTEYWKIFFCNYPANKKGGTDSTAWKKAKSEKLTEKDFILMAGDVVNRARLQPEWLSTYATGITKYIEERVWLTPITRSVKALQAQESDQEMNDWLSSGSSDSFLPEIGGQILEGEIDHG